MADRSGVIAMQSSASQPISATAAVPLHADIDAGKACGMGPGISFANSVRDRLCGGGSGAIGLVPCAVGGTTI
ncbi:unnamed protein product [Linum trigynum]|uniref:Sialate O-acetylesterase domain-containing protein n=1 Tax=Linum trigynum TaxID=586398 RepID=A0AAV2FZ48_9ROSI